MQYNENPWPSMSMQRIMTWGHDFPKDKGVGMLTLNLFGENPCVIRRTHQNCQIPSFLSFLPNHVFCQKVVEVVIAWKGKTMGNFEWGRECSSRMLCFACRDKETHTYKMQRIHTQKNICCSIASTRRPRSEGGE